jgi:hypothetical protein
MTQNCVILVWGNGTPINYTITSDTKFAFATCTSN